MHQTVYGIAFEGNRFLMVWHKRRNGWEMPGGHIELGETPEQACAREFMEESGYGIEIVATRDIGSCYVCAAVLGGRVAIESEMESRLFAIIPDELSFDRDEYVDTITWAKKQVDTYRCRCVRLIQYISIAIASLHIQKYQIFRKFRRFDSIAR